MPNAPPTATDGFIVVPDVFSQAQIAELRAVTDDFVRASARVERE